MSEPVCINRRRAALALAGALAGRGASAQPAAAPKTPQQILGASDAIRNPERPFTVEIDLLEYRQGVATEGSRLLVHARTKPGTGQFRSIVRFLAPARDLNKLMLKDGKDLWFYDPNTKASVRVAPQQRLLGQASNGDVVTAHLALDYTAVEANAEALEDGERQPRHSQRLTLQPASPEAVYPRVELWVDAQTYAPIKARFYADSKRLLKTAFYRKYRSELGALRPTETVIIDGIDNQWVTLLRYSSFAFKDIPESWMQREFLPSFVP